MRRAFNARPGQPRGYPGFCSQELKEDGLCEARGFPSWASSGVLDGYGSAVGGLRGACDAKGLHTISRNPVACRHEQ